MRALETRDAAARPRSRRRPFAHGSGDIVMDNLSSYSGPRTPAGAVRRGMDGPSLQIGRPAPSLARNFERELALAKAFALERRGRNDGRVYAFADGTGRGEELFRADAGLSGLLRKKPQQLPRLPRQMRRVPSGVPVERLLGKQDRRQGMRL
jgi:hypothetical protein